MDDISGNFKNLKGFRSWYVLQHYTFFNGAFVPYTTVMYFDVQFKGNVNVSISGEKK